MAGLKLKRSDAFGLQKGAAQPRKKHATTSVEQEKEEEEEEKEVRKDAPLFQIRRQRLSLPERKVLLKLAFDVLDPEHSGKITRGKLDDIHAELAYLIRTFKTEETRERQRFMVTHGESTLEDIEKEEKTAYKESIDIESDSEHEEQDDSDLGDFIVSDTEIETEIAATQPLQLTYLPLPDKKRLKKKITLEDYPDPE